MSKVLRVLSILVAVLFALSSARWIIDPTGAAEGLGMTLLAGMGASTQIGDIGAFFLAVAVMIGLAQRRGQAHWLYPAAMLFGFAALMRTLASILGHAPFGTEFIVPEAIFCTILLASARMRSDESQGLGTA